MPRSKTEAARHAVAPGLGLGLGLGMDSSEIRLWKKAQEEDPVYKDLIQLWQ